MNLRNKGITQSVIAKRMNVDRSVVSKMENDVYDPSLKKFLKYADACEKEMVMINKRKSK